MCLTISTSPSRMMNISVPRSPWVKTRSPGWNVPVCSFTGSFPPVVLKTAFIASDTSSLDRGSHHRERVVLCAETNEGTDRHQKIISIMPERKITHNRNRERGEKLAQQRIDFGFAAAVFQLPDDHTTDAPQSTGQPEGGQHTVDAVRPFLDLFPEPDPAV